MGILMEVQPRTQNVRGNCRAREPHILSPPLISLQKF